MKQLLTTILALAVSVPAFSSIGESLSSDDNDTLIVNSPRKVTVITNDSLQTVRIEGRHDDYNFHYENTIQLVDSNYVSTLSLNSDRWDFSLPIGKKDEDNYYENVVTTNLGVGGCMALNAPDNMDVSMNSSFEIFWTIAQWNFTPKGGRNTFSVGVGVDWRNYRMSGGDWRFTKLDDDRVDIVPYDVADIRKQFSRIKVFSVQVPLLYSYKFAENFALGAGPVLNLNLHSSLKTRYKVNGEKFKETVNNAHTNPFTIDLMGIVRTPIIDFYVKYSPCNVLKTSKAPKFQSLSVGIYI
ncbi:MAG: hypothetical protein K6C10_08230 [Prevotella sp.]|nr:hypothetical protein [Prevotella sp.]